jgi:hypothetical protein
VAVLLAGGTGVVALKITHAVRVMNAPDLRGAWEGTMHLDDAGTASGQLAATRVVLKFVKTGNGYAATGDLVDLGQKDVPMGRVVYDYPSLRLERTPREIWNLTVKAGGAELAWDHYVHFIQPDPVTFKRTAAPDTVPDPLMADDFAPRPGSDLQGYWKGVISSGADAVPVDVKIAEQADGTFLTEGDNPMEGVVGLPVTLAYHRPTVTLALASDSLIFHGTLNDARTEITGVAIQAGQKLPMSLKRADYPAEHASDADKDYTFSSENDLQGHWHGSWVVTIAKSKALIRLALDIAKLPDGSYSATMTSVDQFEGNAPIPTSDFQYSPPNLQMEWKWAGCAYEGKLANGKLVGHWSQGGGTFPLVFERSH